MHYRSYASEDFVQDEFFRQWVFAPNEERDRFWNNFLRNCPSQRSKVDAAREFLLSMEFHSDVPESAIRDIRLGVDKVIDEYEAHQADQGGGDVRFHMKNYYRIAAALLVFALCATWLIAGNPLGLFGERIAYREVQTPRGDRSLTVLNDGTRVWLNANSALRFAADFAGGDTREVYLDGEAFFDVAEDKSKPFIVHASGVSVEVLGTAFNVLSYQDDDVVETTLVRGKVDIVANESDSDGHLTLLPNQRAVFHRQTGKIELDESVNVDDHIAWKDGAMIFDNRPFSYIKETMERWYDVTIEMEDESSIACTFTARFRDMTLEQVLEVFRNTQAINYRIVENHVYISGKLCQDQTH